MARPKVNYSVLKCYCSLLLLLVCGFSFAQVNQKKQDTAKVYRAIENYSKKRKFTNYLHRLIFEPITEKKKISTPVKKIRKQNYAKFEGKIIRNIKITTLDPFSYSVTDTTKKPSKKMAKAGNVLHMKTRNFAIRNILLFKKNQPLDSLLVKESERLIRRQRFVRSVAITTTLASKNSDSVDVSIRVLDSWSLVPDLTLSSSKSTFFLKERNFLGTGHEFTNSYTKELNSSNNGFGTSYTIPNIRNTFIRTNLRYNIDIDGNYAKSFDIERPFFSAYTRWAGGVNISQQFQRIPPVDSAIIDTTANSKFNSQDLWAGHSVQIFKGNSENNRSTNFITSARFFNKEYSDKPIFGDDTLGVFSNEKLYLLSLGISSRKYKQDKYVFNFDVVEDIASGFVYSVTTGFRNKNSFNQVYFGAKVAIGGYFDFGYLSTDLQYGTFFNKDKTTQSAYNLSVIYFTNLIDAGRWKFRQFIKPQAIIGTKRIESNTDRLTLNGDTGIPGFNSNALFGTKKLLLTFQTQAYSPWHLVGFRLNPYLSYTMGMLGQPQTHFAKSKLYSELALGVIISNDYWVFSNFQFSFSYFPNLPDDITKVYKTNSLKTYDFGLQEFEIGKPTLVNYQ
ncbi:hypothetical protein G4D82_13335 [Flavobacterium sp. CYK-4]|uniref:hypothetical protein n=1 Tax=Flavobacterium lotistagni TaxID=2709660 RepID=UPI00140BC40A|nr:hypothetical protein [Flavobacterium lotistagni]NHM08207.1 hypothetical protein [Flavobacterium lotistagni]